MAIADNVRVPFIALNKMLSEIGVKRELMVDFDNGDLYYKSRDGRADVLINKRYFVEEVDKFIKEFTKGVDEDNQSSLFLLDRTLKEIEDWVNLIYKEDDDIQVNTILEIINKFKGMEFNGKTLKEMLDARVDKVPGKGLSTENFTCEECKKLKGIEKYANCYIHPDEKQCSYTEPVSAINNMKGDVILANENIPGLLGVDPNANYYIHPREKQCKAKVVTSVNGRVGKVTISKTEIGMGDINNKSLIKISDIVENNYDLTNINGYATPSAISNSIIFNMSKSSKHKTYYLGKAFNFITYNELFTALGLSDNYKNNVCSSDMNEFIPLHKYFHKGSILYIPEGPFLMNVSFIKLRELGLVSDDKGKFINPKGSDTSGFYCRGIKSALSYDSEAYDISNAEVFYFETPHENKVKPIRELNTNKFLKSRGLTPVYMPNNYDIDNTGDVDTPYITYTSAIFMENIGSFSDNNGNKIYKDNDFNMTQIDPSTPICFLPILELSDKSFIGTTDSYINIYVKSEENYILDRINITLESTETKPGSNKPKVLSKSVVNAIEMKAALVQSGEYKNYYRFTLGPINTGSSFKLKVGSDDREYYPVDTIISTVKNKDYNHKVILKSKDPIITVNLFFYRTPIFTKQSALYNLKAVTKAKVNSLSSVITIDKDTQFKKLQHIQTSDVRLSKYQVKQTIKIPCKGIDHYLIELKGKKDIEDQIIPMGQYYYTLSSLSIVGDGKTISVGNPSGVTKFHINELSKKKNVTELKDIIFEDFYEPYVLDDKIYNTIKLRPGGEYNITFGAKRSDNNIVIDRGGADGYVIVVPKGTPHDIIKKLMNNNKLPVVKNVYNVDDKPKYNGKLVTGGLPSGEYDIYYDESNELKAINNYFTPDLLNRNKITVSINNNTMESIDKVVKINYVKEKNTRKEIFVELHQFMKFEKYKVPSGPTIIDTDLNPNIKYVKLKVTIRSGSDTISTPLLEFSRLQSDGYSGGYYDEYTGLMKFEYRSSVLLTKEFLIKHRNDPVYIDVSYDNSYSMEIDRNKSKIFYTNATQLMEQSGSIYIKINRTKAKPKPKIEYKPDRVECAMYIIQDERSNNFKPLIADPFLAKVSIYRTDKEPHSKEEYIWMKYVGVYDSFEEAGVKSSRVINHGNYHKKYGDKIRKYYAYIDVERISTPGKSITYDAVLLNAFPESFKAGSECVNHFETWEGYTNKVNNSITSMHIKEFVCVRKPKVIWEPLPPAPKGRRVFRIKTNPIDANVSITDGAMKLRVGEEFSLNYRATFNIVVSRSGYETKYDTYTITDSSPAEIMLSYTLDKEEEDDGEMATILFGAFLKSDDNTLDGLLYMWDESNFTVVLNDEFKRVCDVNSYRGKFDANQPDGAISDAYISYRDIQEEYRIKMTKLDRVINNKYFLDNGSGISYYTTFYIPVKKFLRMYRENKFNIKIEGALKNEFTIDKVHTSKLTNTPSKLWANKVFGTIYVELGYDKNKSVLRHKMKTIKPALNRFPTGKAKVLCMTLFMARESIIRKVEREVSGIGSSIFTLKQVYDTPILGYNNRVVDNINYYYNRREFNHNEMNVFKNHSTTEEAKMYFNLTNNHGSNIRLSLDNIFEGRSYSLNINGNSSTIPSGSDDFAIIAFMGRGQDVRLTEFDILRSIDKKSVLLTSLSPDRDPHQFANLDPRFVSNSRVKFPNIVIDTSGNTMDSESGSMSRISVQNVSSVDVFNGVPYYLFIQTFTFLGSYSEYSRRNGDGDVDPPRRRRRYKEDEGGYYDDYNGGSGGKGESDSNDNWFDYGRSDGPGLTDGWG